MSLQNFIGSCDIAIKAVSSLNDAKQNAIAFMAEHQTLVDRNACLESEIAEQHLQVLSQKEQMLASEAKALALTKDKEKIQSKNLDLNVQVSKLRRNLLSAEENIQTLRKEKDSFELEKAALCQKSAILTLEKLAAERHAQDLSNQNKVLQEIICTMKAELLECRKETGRSRPVSLSPERVAGSDKMTFVEISFDDDQSNEDNEISMGSDGDYEGSCCDVASAHAFRTPMKRKRRVVKVPRSPKKWRRMIRDNRLQSIFIGQ